MNLKIHRVFNASVIYILLSIKALITLTTLKVIFYFAIPYIYYSPHSKILKIVSNLFFIIVPPTYILIGRGSKILLKIEKTIVFLL